MTLLLDNSQRKFLVQSQGFGSQRDIFCNLHQIESVLKESFNPREEFKIYEYWNRKLTRVGKKRINEIFAANQITFRIK